MRLTGRHGQRTFAVPLFADVTARDSKGRLPLHYAAANESGEAAAAVIRLLAQAPGFDANARRSREEQGTTALHIAAQRWTCDGSCTKAIVQALLEAGAGEGVEETNTQALALCAVPCTAAAAAGFAVQAFC